MKNIKRLLTLAICLAVVAGTMAVIPSKAYAEGYTYNITVNAGKEGTLNGDSGNSVIKTYKGIENGGHVTITEEDLGLKVNDDSTYYIRGLKVSGHDNDETSTRHYQFPVTVNNVNEDISFSVAYGVKGDMIDYVVKYVDASNPGNELLPSRTYYGTPGDYLIVSAEYIDGYLPDAYNKGWTLKEDGIREIVFYMSPANQNNGNNGNNGGNNGNQGANQGGNQGAGAANAGANAGNGQPANFVNLDDGQTPTGTPDDVNGGNGDGNDGSNGGDGTSNIEDQNTPASLIERVGLLPLILAGGLLAALIALIAFLRSRGEDDDEETADELEDMLHDPDAIEKLAKADKEQFKTTDPDELAEAFKEIGKKE